MSLKNEAKSAFRETREFYSEYMSGMSRETIGKEFEADTTRIKQLYKDVIEEETRRNGRRLTGTQKVKHFFLTMSKRLNPTRRLIFGISTVAILLHLFLTVIGESTQNDLYGLLVPLAFFGISALLLIELLEKSDVKKELDLARDIQLSLLPNTDIAREALDIHAFANTAQEVGGDYVDIIETPKGTYVIVADVSGKGLSAALYMVRIQALVHLIINSGDPSPKKLFLELNDYIKSNKHDKTFVTACCAFFPVGSNEFIFSRAGHNTPILFMNATNTTMELNTGGLALGMASTNMLRDQLEEKTYGFSTGDSLLLYTDGVNEARNNYGEEFGQDRIETLMSIYGSLHARTICQKLHAALDVFIGDEKITDDITFAAVHHH